MKKRVMLVFAVVVLASLLHVPAAGAAVDVVKPPVVEPAASAPFSGEMVTKRLGGSVFRMDGDGYRSAAVSSAATGLVTLFANGFETAPSPWATEQYYSPVGWGLTSYRRTEGSFAAYCAGNGRTAPGPYAPDMETWLIAGPFDLRGYASAGLSFDFWNVSEYDYDFFFVGASTDNDTYDGYAQTGSTPVWSSHVFDLTRWCGQSRVYVAFMFMSDEMDQFEGAYVDNVRLQGVIPNYAPVAVNDVYYTHPNTPKTVAAPGVLANDSDQNGDPMYAYIYQQPMNGSVSLNTNGSFTYTPSSGFTGQDAFTYKVLDGTNWSSAATVTMNVGNQSPTGYNDHYTTAPNVPKVVAAPGVLANDKDPDGDTLSAIKFSDPSNGTLTLNANGSFTYTPNQDYKGMDQFYYRVADGYGGLSEPAMVSIQVAVQLDPVYRFYNRTNGTHFFTPSLEEANGVIAKWPHIFTYEGTAYFTNPYNNTQPLYRFYNKVNGSHFYTASLDEANSVLVKWPHVFSLDGQTYAVSPTPVGNCVPVYRFYNKRNGSHFYTASIEERDTVIARFGATYDYEGPCFWLGQ